MSEAPDRIWATRSEFEVIGTGRWHANDDDAPGLTEYTRTDRRLSPETVEDLRRWQKHYPSYSVEQSQQQAERIITTILKELGESAEAER